MSSSLLPVLPASPTSDSMGVQAGFARLLPDTLAARGLPSQAIWAALGLPPDQAPEGTRVPVEALGKALTLARDMVGDPLIVLEAAQSVSPAHLGNLGYALMSSTLGQDGLAMYERFQTLLCNELLSHHRISKGLIQIQHEPVAAGMLPRNALFWWFLFGSRLHFARWVSGRDLVPVRIDIPAPAPARADAFARFVGCTVRYDTPDARELMPAEWLHWFNPNSDPALHALMEARTVRQMSSEARTVEDALLSRVRVALASSLKQGLDVSLDTVCRALDLSPRQLQKRLHDHGLNFKALIEEVRRERALHLLRDSSKSILEIAQDCGYTELSPFHRAIRRWTGLTPAQVRQQAQQEAQST